MPKDLSYSQKINVLDFIIYKVKLFKQNFKPTRWEFEFLLNELNESYAINNFKNSILREKYSELFKSFKSIIKFYLNNYNRSIETNIFNFVIHALTSFFYYRIFKIFYRFYNPIFCIVIRFSLRSYTIIMIVPIVHNLLHRISNKKSKIVGI